MNFIKEMRVSIIIIVLLHILLFCFALAPFYVEGDDASTIIHHVLGGEIQPVYSSYHGMFDKYLSVFGNSEVILRKVGVFTSFFSSLLSLLVLSYLINLKEIKLSKFSYLISFVLVEFMFWALILNPTAVAFIFILLAHIFLIKYQKTQKNTTLLLSVLLFGLGVSFRWSTGFYLFVLFSEFIFTDNIKSILNKQNFIKSLYIFPLFLLSVLLFIYCSGYTPLDIYRTYSSGTSYMDNKEISYLALFAKGITFITPALLVTLTLSLYWALKEKKVKLLFMFIFSLLPYIVVLGVYPALKYMITIIPVLFFLILDTRQLYSVKIIRRSIIVLILIPFFIGFQVDSNSAWGPGFYIKRTSEQINYNEVKNFNPDKSTKTKNISPVFMGGGCAMPTSEGPRPLWGFGKVLLHDWKELVLELDKERSDAVKYAIKHNYNIAQDVRHSFITTKLLETTFRTTEEFNHRVNNQLERTFFNDTKEIIIKVPDDKNKLFDVDYFSNNFKEDGVVIYSTYTNIISKLTHSNTIDFKQKGAYWGVIKLK